MQLNNVVPRQLKKIVKHPKHPYTEENLKFAAGSTPNINSYACKSLQERHDSSLCQLDLDYTSMRNFITVSGEISGCNQLRSYCFQDQPVTC